MEIVYKLKAYARLVLENNAISKKQYDKKLGDLREKMEMYGGRSKPGVEYGLFNSCRYAK